MNKRTKRCGHTLVELVMSASLIAIIAGGIFALAQDSQAMFHTSLKSVRAARGCSTALHRVQDDVEVANPATFAIIGAAPEGDLITLQVPIAIAGGVVTWGARAPVNGATVDFAGATIQYRVEPAASGRLTLVRRVIDGAGVALVADELIADDADEPDADLGKPLIAVRNGRLVTLSFRIRLSHDADRGDAGEDLIKSQQITVRLRNP